jgi:hypothetical protein
MPAPYYRFDGVDDRITVGSHANLQPNLSDFTWACWFINEGITGSDNALIEYGSGSDRAVIYLDGSSYIVWYTSDGSNAITTTTNKTAITDTNWHHVVCVVDRSSATGQKIYIDGVEETYSAQGDATTLTGSIEPTTFVIGDNYVASGEHKGSINDVKLYNTALTAPEVKELYSGASVPFKYKGANQTNLIIGGALDDQNGTFETGGSDGDDVSTGTDWVKSNTSAELDNEAGSGVNTYNGSTFCAKIHTATGNYPSIVLSGANFESQLTIGKRYRVSFDYKVGGTQGPAGSYVRLTTGSVTTNLTLASTSWTSVSMESDPIPATASAELRFYSEVGTAEDGDEILWIDNVSLVQIGAVAEYDGSSAGSYQWGDKSGNALHGTVGDGAGGATAPTLENTPYDSGTEYEEGTWDGVLSDGTRDMSMTITTGYYTKVGNLVTVTGFFKTDSLDGGSGNATGSIRITGLPFTVANADGAYSGGGAADGQGFDITAGESVCYYGIKNATYLILLVWNATTGVSAMQASEWTDDGGIILGFSYRAA